MERRQYQEFIDSGLVHIVAVSGGNIVMVVAGAMIVLWRLPWYARTYTMMLIIIAYAVLVGPDSSIIRATIMGIVAYMALIQGRPVVVWRALCYAAILMLLWNPYFLLVDIGFVFSFASVIGLVIMQSRLQIAVKGKSIPKKSIILFRNLYAVPTLSATLGVLPFLLYFTSSYNLLSIIANIVVLPLIPLIMIVGFLTLLT